jgi:type I restriction enzyme M protein
VSPDSLPKTPRVCMLATVLNHPRLINAIEPFGSSTRGKIRDISIYGQESNYATWDLGKMNFAIRDIEGQITGGDTFRNDRHSKADYVPTNPPFNDRDRRAKLLGGDKRWQ